MNYTISEISFETDNDLAFFYARISYLYVAVRRVREDFQWSIYIQNLNRRRTEDDDPSHFWILLDNKS
jgi:hypothetical protein